MLDTSVWIACLRGAAFSLEDQVQSLVLQDRVLLCGTIEFELLAGVRKEERQGLEKTLAELEYRELLRDDHRKAAALSREPRAKGKTLQYMDLLIAAFCIRRKLALMTLDRDFDGIAGLLRLVPNLF